MINFNKQHVNNPISQTTYTRGGQLIDFLLDLLIKTLIRLVVFSIYELKNSLYFFVIKFCELSLGLV